MRLIANVTGATAIPEAAEDLTARLDDFTPEFVLVYSSEALDIAALRDAVLRRMGAARIHGGTTCRGVMTNGDVRLRPGAGLLAIHDPKGAYGVGSSPIGDDARAAGRVATFLALADAGHPGEQPDLVWLTTAPGDEEAVLAGIADVVGSSTPVIGGSAADDNVTGVWRQIDGRTTHDRGVVVSALFPSKSFGFAYQNGYADTAHAGVVTRASGRRIHEIDGQPARAVLSRWSDNAFPPVGDEVSILAGSTLHPLARDVAAGPHLAAWRRLIHPATAHADGSVSVFAAIAEGERLRMMRGTADSILRRGARVANLAREVAGDGDAEVAGALMVYCGGCMMAVQNRMPEVAEEVSTALSGAPFLGLFSFGEQGMSVDGCNSHGNLMVSCIVFRA